MIRFVRSCAFAGLDISAIMWYSKSGFCCGLYRKEVYVPEQYHKCRINAHRQYSSSDAERKNKMTLFQIPGVMKLIRTEIPSDVKEKKLIEKMDNLFITSYKPEYVTEAKRGSEELVDRIWLYASLIDDALSDTVCYNAEKYHCEDEWNTAVRWLKFELPKKRFFGGMVYDVSKLCTLASASLDCLNPESCGQSLVGWIQKNGESLTDFYAVISDLKVRLDEIAELYERYQKSFESD